MNLKMSRKKRSLRISLTGAECWWITSVILATQKAEIRRNAVQSQPGQILPKTLS
jgi:hypothetical protein